MMKVLALIPTLRDYPNETIESLMNQVNVSIDIVVIGGYLSAKPYTSKVKWVHVTPNMSEPKGLRITKALNVALNTVNLNEYDYLLKADSDTVFPPEFMIHNIEADYDLMGSGCALIMKMDKFIEATGGKLTLCSTEDTYLYAQAKALGMNILSWGWIDSPVTSRKVRFTQRELWITGKDVAGMGGYLRKKKWVTRPVQLLGYLFGIATHYRLPVHDALMRARNKEKRNLIRRLVEL